MYGLTQMDMPFAPQILWYKKDYEKYWEHVDKSISRTHTNIGFKDLIQTYYSIYKNTNEDSKPFSYFDDLTVEDYVEYFFGGKERVKMLKELFRKLGEKNIKIVFISANWSLKASPKLWKEILSVIIPYNNYEMHYVGYEIDWNKILKLYTLGYGTLCKSKNTKAKSKLITVKNHSKRYSKTRKKSDRRK
jgi:hypothetical protein